MGILSPIDMLKNKVSGFSFDNDFLDTLVGAKIRNIGEAAEDKFYGMFGAMGMKALDAKEAAEQQQVVAGKVSYIYPNKKLRKKMLALIIRRLVMKGSARGVKDKDQQERIEKVKRAITAANDLGQLLKAIKQAVRLEPSVAGAVDKFYEEALQMGEDEDFDSLADNMNMDDPKGANAVKQMLIDAKQTEFQDTVREDPRSLTPEYIKKHQDEVQDIIKLDSDELRKYLKNVGKNEAPQIKEQFKEIAIQSALGTMPEITLSTPSAPAAGKSKRGSSKAAKQAQKTEPKASTPATGRQMSRQQLTSAASGHPNVKSMLSGDLTGTAGAMGDTIAAELGSASAEMSSGELVMAMDRLEGALVELGNMLSSGEISPSQLGQAFSGLTEGENSIEAGIEQENWEDNMLENTVAIKEALETGDKKVEEEENGGILSGIFDFFKSKLGPIVEKLLPMLSGLLAAIPALLSALGGKAMGALSSAGDFLGKGKAGAGKFLKSGLGKASVGGLVGGLALDYAGEKLAESGHEKLAAGADIGSDALSMASTGAMIGSVIPGVGTVVGGAVGGLAGAGYGVYKNWDTLFGGTKETPTEQLKQQNEEQKKYEEQVAAQANAKNAGSTVVNAPTTVNNNTVMPPQSNWAPVRTGESAITRAKDRYAIVR